MVIQAAVSFLVLIGIFVLSFFLETHQLGFLSNINAAVIVLGGTLFATLLAYPAEKLALTVRLLKESFSHSNEIAWSISTLVRLSRIYKKGGVLALEREADKLPPGLIHTGIGLMAYDFSRENVEQILHKEALLTVQSYETAYKILCSMARLAPAMGLAGTVVSLIRTFGHMSSPQNLSGYMAIALLSTFYGVVLANICLVPLSNKLREYLDADLLRMDILKEGILDIYDGEHPRALQYKLETLAGIPSEPYRPEIRLVEPSLSAGQGNG
ncbi:MAG: MotA/TolQ/ExbB proton channel family protein [Syntrophaceae bacterium]|jgi:chemotaxis protein MotA|nr:MotA/TolQ/ExbB proton channel family protein [Syntrophaceae bacterium]HQM45209.1 MotA/TolQ/ExbB proton channel family protein [Smithellaceae bacterium]